MAPQGRWEGWRLYEAQVINEQTACKTCFREKTADLRRKRWTAT